MIYREPYGRVAEAWILHVGCPSDFVNSSAACALATAVGSGRLRLDWPLETSPGVPYGQSTYYRTDAPRVLPTGVYTVESTGLQLAPLRVTALLGLGSGESHQDLAPDALVDPRETVPTFGHATCVDSGDPAVLDDMPGVCAFYENR
jgi:hypothetical protein